MKVITVPFIDFLPWQVTITPLLPKLATPLKSILFKFIKDLTDTSMKISYKLFPKYMISSGRIPKAISIFASSAGEYCCDVGGRDGKSK